MIKYSDLRSHLLRTGWVVAWSNDDVEVWRCRDRKHSVTLPTLPGKMDDRILASVITLISSHF